MGFFDKFPYTDFHELNLDWILAAIKELNASMTEFEALNKITFSGTWDITQQYPAWTIVNDNGFGYVSIQPVPAGVLINNTDYWRSVIDYSATIADLQNRMITAENDINNLQSDVSDLQSDVQNIQNKKVLIIADSYGMVHDTTFLTILKSSLPDVYDGVGVSSIGFTPISPYTFEDQFDLFIANYTDEEKEEVTDICICGGWNDARQIWSGAETRSSLKSAIISTAAHMQTVCPNAIIHPCFMAWHSALSSQNQVDLSSLTETMRAYEDVIGFNIRPICEVKYVMRDINAMDASLFHPNETVAAPALAAGLNACLMSGSWSYATSWNFVPAYLDTNNAFDASTVIRVSVDGNTTKISSVPNLMNGSTPGGIVGVFNSAHTPIILPTASAGPLGSGNIIIVPCFVKGQINGVTYTNYVPTVMYWYAATGNLLLLAPDGSLATSLSSAYMIINAAFDNETCL